jgi:ABC-type transport system involved in cytochrome c biogenesis permease subunit
LYTPTVSWFVVASLIPFGLGGVIALAVPWRLRRVAVFGLALAIAFWAISVLSSTPDYDSGGDPVPVGAWTLIYVGATLIALALFCAGGWLGKAGRKALLGSRRL